MAQILRKQDEIDSNICYSSSVFLESGHSAFIRIDALWLSLEKLVTDVVIVITLSSQSCKVFVTQK